MSETDFPDYNPFCPHGSEVGVCYVCQLEDEVTSRTERISELVAENTELKKDAEELAARRWLDWWTWDYGLSMFVDIDTEKDKEYRQNKWGIEMYDDDKDNITASSPQDLARKLGWKP